MPLTPDDVRNKRFTPVRLREGYDMGEVDQFLDEVEATLEATQKENDELRAKLEAAQSGTRPAPAGRAAEPAKPAEAPPATTTPKEASSAAARLLELATKNADELVEEAKGQADQIVGEARSNAERVETEARSKAERMETEARTKAERMESDARTRAERLDQETAERRTQLIGKLEQERDRLTQELEELRGFEREYRSRLKAYFESQLAVLNGEESKAQTTRLPSSGAEAGKAGGSSEEEGSQGLRSILGDEG
jgi:DivIVA domain-containing protein